MKHVLPSPKISLPSIAFEHAKYYPKVKNVFARILIGILFFDAVFGALAIIKVTTPPSAHMRASMAAAIEPLLPTTRTETALSAAIQDLDGETKALKTRFEDQGFAVTSAERSSRSELSVPGTILTVAGENVSVFAYSDSDTAKAEAAALAKKYADATARNVWAGHAHVYVKDSAIVFYLGTRSDITGALDLYTGNPVATKS